MEENMEVINGKYHRQSYFLLLMFYRVLYTFFYVSFSFLHCLHLRTSEH